MAIQKPNMINHQEPTAPPDIRPGQLIPVNSTIHGDKTGEDPIVVERQGSLSPFVNPFDKPSQIDKIVKPIITFLNRKFPSKYKKRSRRYKFASYTEMGHEFPPADEVMIQLPIIPSIDEEAMDAIYTLLVKTGTDDIFDPGFICDCNPYVMPLRFEVTKRTLRSLTDCITLRYLVVKQCWHRDDKAAREQIRLLIDYLDNCQSLIGNHREAKDIF